MATYRVVRFYQRSSLENEVVVRGLTLKQAQEHCKAPAASSRTATSSHARARTRRHGDWFEGYQEE